VEVVVARIATLLSSAHNYDTTLHLINLQVFILA